jgi:hypothetical protein
VVRACIGAPLAQDRWTSKGMKTESKGFVAHIDGEGGK